MDSFQEWEGLCAKYESAQDENTTAYLAITARLFMGGRDGQQMRPTAVELARWDATRERLRNVDGQMRSFVRRLADDERSATVGLAAKRPAKSGTELH